MPTQEKTLHIDIPTFGPSFSALCVPLRTYNQPSPSKHGPDAFGATLNSLREDLPFPIPLICKALSVILKLILTNRINLVYCLQSRGQNS